MTEQRQPIRVEEVDWQELFPWINLFRSFRMAMHAPKLLLALGLVIVLFLYGTGLDLIFGDQVYPEEVQKYKQLGPVDFDRWYAGRENDLAVSLRNAVWALPSSERAQIEGDISKALRAIDKHFEDHPNESAARAEMRRKVREIQPRGVFESALTFKLDAFERMVLAATAFNFGIDDLLAVRPYDPNTVIGALRDLVVVLPGWLFHSHLWFLAAWMVGAALLWALVGGTIARLAALDACLRRRIPTAQAMRYARGKFWWFLLAPIIPLLVVMLLVVVMALTGMVFNMPVTDILGGLLFPLWLAGGVVVTVVLIGLAGGANLLYPAIAVEGTEAFDALSRAYHYVYFRPWRLVFYHLAALVYGAITYLFVGLVIFLSLWMTQRFAGAWVFTDAAQTGVNRFDAIMPPPQIGKLVYETDWGVLSATGKVTAVLIKVWVMLLVGVLPAYAISYYFASNTWVYLLLRRVADGAAFDDIDAAEPEAGAAPAAAPDKVETDSPAEAPEL